MLIKQDVSAAAVKALQTALSADFSDAKVSNTGSDMLRVSLSTKCDHGESSKSNQDRFVAMVARVRHWHVLWPSFMIKISMVVTDRRNQQVAYSFQETIEQGKRLAA